MFSPYWDGEVMTGKPDGYTVYAVSADDQMSPQGWRARGRYYDARRHGRKRKRGPAR